MFRVISSFAVAMVMIMIMILWLHVKSSLRLIALIHLRGGGVNLGRTLLHLRCFSLSMLYHITCQAKKQKSSTTCAIVVLSELPSQP